MAFFILYRYIRVVWVNLNFSVSLGAPRFIFVAICLTLENEREIMFMEKAKPKAPFKLKIVTDLL